MTRISTSRRPGLSLLEVMLAIAILGGAIVVIGELIRIAARNAAEARDQTTVQLLCESKMAELVAGLSSPQTTGPTPCDSNPDFVYSVNVESTDQERLLAVSVTVQNADSRQQPTTFTLTRWMLDPEVAAELAAQSAATNTTSTSGTSAGTATP